MLRFLKNQLAIRPGFSIVPGVILSGVGGGMAFPVLPLAALNAGVSLSFIGLIGEVMGPVTFRDPSGIR